jgi:hypothetical protein
MGRVVNLDTSQLGKIGILLHDGTGLCDLAQYVDQDSTGVTRLEIEPNTFVELIVSIKQGSGGAMMANIQHSRPIRDGNLITAHILETIYNHLYNTRGPLTQVAAAPAASAAASNYAYGSGGFASNSASASYAASGGVLMGQTHGHHGGEQSDQDQVIDFFRTFQSDDGNDSGGSIADCFHHVGRRNGWPMAKLKKIADALLDTGALYTTVDDEHFKTTS